MPFLAKSLKQLAYFGHAEVAVRIQGSFVACVEREAINCLRSMTDDKGDRSQDLSRA